MEDATIYLSAIIESSEDAIIGKTLDGIVTSWNKAAEKIFGYTRAEIIGKSILVLVPPGLHDEELKILEKLKNGERIDHYETIRIKKDGSHIRISLTASPIKDINGKIIGISKIARDITEKIKIEEELKKLGSEKKAEERFRLVVEAAPNAMIMVGKGGKITLVNSQTEVLFGYQRNELLDQKIEMLVPERFRGNHPGHRDSFFADPKARAMGVGRDLFGLRKDGVEVPIEIGLNPIKTEEGTFVLASIIDITERKKAEERFRLVVEAAPNAKIMVGKEGKMTLVNTQTETLFRYTRQELIGQKIEILVPERFRGNHPSHRDSFFGDPKTRAMGVGRDLFGLRKDGIEVPIEIGLNPIKTTEGTFVLASIIDITERKKLEELKLEAERIKEKEREIEREKEHQAQLIQTAKLSSIGLLSAGVAHELNSPLTGLLVFLKLHLEDTARDTKKHEELSVMLEATEHMAKIVSDLTAFARESKDELTKVNLNDVIESTLSFSSAQLIRNGIKITKKFSDDLLSVHASKRQLQQVVLNLIMNAKDAMLNGGELTINTYNLKDTSKIAIEFIDTGVGIRAEDIPRLFTPFFTTKEPGKGTGLGLFVSYGIIEDHQGEIKVESKINKGTKFKILIPASK